MFIIKNKISLFILTISFILFTTCLTFKIKYNKFSCNKTLKDIEYLSSYDLEGRLPGSSGNEKASDYIEKEFKNSGLLPLSKEYKQYFKLKTPKQIDGSSSLCIKDSNGNIIKNFSCPKDFKEDFINFRDNTLEFNSKDEMMIFPSSLIVFKEKKSFLFYIPKENNFNFRSSFYSDFDSSFAIKITGETYDSIIENVRSNNTISCKVPYIVDETNVCNVAGIIKGQDETLPPLILTAHFDHLGIDNKILYPGALDNASGTSFLLELARTYGSMPKPKRSIIFVAFNAEEYGLLGSKNFVENNISLINNATVLNFDMMGSFKKPSLSIMASKEDNPLIDEFKDLFTCNGVSNIKVNISENSDHSSFSNKNINSITLSEDDTSNIHTPKDTYDKIIPETFNRNYTILNQYISEHCYYKYSFLIYNNILLIISFSIFTLFYILYVFKNNKRNSQ